MSIILASPRSQDPLQSDPSTAIIVLQSFAASSTMWTIAIVVVATAPTTIPPALS
jgi:hypothetical protein